jgi:RNA-directed DNA polymerase
MISLERWPKVKELREKLNGRAKAKPTFRFYILYDKVHRKDFLEAAYAQCKHNDGAPGVDGTTFEDIEKQGVERYLEELSRELKEYRYQPQAVKRVMIEKPGKPGEFRPLGIPTIRDRVADQRVLALIRNWLKVPVHETTAKGRIAIHGGKNTKVGTPQGGVISPLLANI